MARMSRNSPAGRRQASRAADAAAKASVNSVAPAITGTARDGETLTCSTGTWSGSPTLTYQWLRNGVPIAGATANTRVLVDADVGATMKCVVKAARQGVTAEKITAATTAVLASTAPVNTVLPAISGTPTVGETLTTTNGTWTGAPTPTFARQWKRGGVAISGATATTYVLVEADIGAVITCTVTATNDAAAVSATSAGTAAVEGIAPVNTVAPSITGTAQVGETLTAADGTWTGTPTPVLTRQWNADDVAIEGETGTTYEPVVGDIGAVITVTVTATNVADAVSETSAGTDPVIAE